MTRLEEIKARAEKATVGPWVVYLCGNQDPGSACGVNYGFDASYDECHHVLAQTDADFIAHSRADVSWLVERVKRLEAALQKAPCNCIRAPGAKHKNYCFTFVARKALEED